MFNIEEELRKIEDFVFEKQTLLAIGKLMEKGYFNKIDYPILSGKESFVFRASKDEKYVAVKIYRLETTAFFDKKKYIMFDPRFKLTSKKLRDVVCAFTKKEFKNLEIAWKNKVSVPCPFAFQRNVLVMEFLGEKGLPYPQLKDVKVEKWMAEKVIEEVKKLYINANLVHCDLSEYNILVDKDKVFLIDFAEAVPLDYPNSEKFLRRDINNITNFFRKKKIELNPEHVLEYVKGKRDAYM